LAGPSSAPTPRPDPLRDPLPNPLLGARVRLITRRFAEVVCPPGLRAHHRTDRVLAEFELTLAALAPGARKAMTAAMVALDQGARLYPRSRGRRFARLDDQAAEAYIRVLLARGGVAAQLVQRLRGLVVMCYYELSPVQREIGYDPAPYIAAVSRRRLESYGPEIEAAEAAATEAETMIMGQNGRYLPKTTHDHEDPPGAGDGRGSGEG
jgi:hypothetical protein